jgi:hypothetical protein
MCCVQQFVFVTVVVIGRYGGEGWWEGKLYWTVWRGVGVGGKTLFRRALNRNDSE